MTLSIIIPCYITDEQLYKLTKRCLVSIRKYTAVKYEIIIIDDAGDKKYIDFLSKNSDIYIRHKDNKKNNALAWNEGGYLAIGKYLCFMDNDVKVLKNWDKPLIKMLKNIKVGVAFPISKCKEDLQFKKRIDGFCFTISNLVFKKVGIISQEWGLYFEDTDYTMKLQSLGYLLKSCPDSKVLHYARATTDKDPWIEVLYLRNKEKYEKKWGGLYPGLNL